MSKSSGNKVAVILSGCGVYDGSEIYETVATLIRLDEKDVEVQCYAPNVDQMHVINHLTGEEMSESRNVLVEAARLARGNVKDITEATVDGYDALIVPGGFGAAKNLSDFAIKGAGLTVQADFLRLAQAFQTAGKPIGLICIAPSMSAAICGEGVTCTIGSDTETAKAIEEMGAQHQNCGVSEICIDTERKLVTTPAYMLADNIGQAVSGINKLVDKVIELIE